MFGHPCARSGSGHARNNSRSLRPIYMPAPQAHTRITLGAVTLPCRKNEPEEDGQEETAAKESLTYHSCGEPYDAYGETGRIESLALPATGATQPQPHKSSR